MHVSRAADYGLIGLIYLAEQEDNAASVSAIARDEDLALAFLRKVFQKLQNAGIVTSRRGSGYRLARPAKKITAREVVEAIDGPVEVKSCLRDPTSCRLGNKCRLTNLWTEVQSDVLKKLENISVADLA